MHNMKIIFEQRYLYAEVYKTSGRPTGHYVVLKWREEPSFLEYQWFRLKKGQNPEDLFNEVTEYDEDGRLNWAY